MNGWHRTPGRALRRQSGPRRPGAWVREPPRSWTRPTASTTSSGTTTSTPTTPAPARPCCGSSTGRRGFSSPSFGSGPPRSSFPLTETTLGGRRASPRMGTSLSRRGMRTMAPTTASSPPCRRRASWRARCSCRRGAPPRSASSTPARAARSSFTARGTTGSWATAARTLLRPPAQSGGASRASPSMTSTRASGLAPWAQTATTGRTKQASSTTASSTMMSSPWAALTATPPRASTRSTNRSGGGTSLR
mmetsp:Transcript_36964/g.94438  ORF Transcript_36964/g.94438 Transcript_36964/m.94438 type:complete len:249 (+) Transcript_36964:158-904(+)